VPDDGPDDSDLAFTIGGSARAASVSSTIAPTPTTRDRRARRRHPAHARAAESLDVAARVLVEAVP
jgi:hypothetical protein